MSYVDSIIRPAKADRRAEGTFLLSDTTVWRKYVLVETNSRDCSSGPCQWKSQLQNDVCCVPPFSKSQTNTNSTITFTGGVLKGDSNGDLWGRERRPRIRCQKSHKALIHDYFIHDYFILMRLSLSISHELNYFLHNRSPSAHHPGWDIKPSQLQNQQKICLWG